MTEPRRNARAPVALAFAGCVLALVIALAGSTILALVAGLATVGIALALGGRRPPAGDEASDPSRRRLLAGAAAGGAALVVAGTVAGRELKRFVRPDPRPILEGMATDLGAEYLELIRRGFHADRSGDLQLILAPGSSSNYPPESTSLVPMDPRTSHAAVWHYLERVPIVVYAPGIVAAGRDSEERVTLADLAPTTGTLMGFDFPAPDGSTLPGLERPGTPPKVIVTFVIDGGGWNVLQRWGESWPTMKRLMRGGATYRNAIVGSFPAVTACAHATIGTGAFPNTHGISGHNLRMDGEVVKAYGAPGAADTTPFLLAPTLAEAWSQETGDGAWVGEIGYQIWHLGMIGRGGERPLGELPVATYWPEELDSQWTSLNPDLYRLPREVPPIELLAKHRATLPAPPPSPFDLGGTKADCCAAPIVEYQGDLIASAFASEPIGEDDVTDLLYINFKAPDYAGHVYNVLDERVGGVLSSVDRQLDRVVRLLESRFAPGEFALVVTADHGQCPTVDVDGGVRVDPIQLDADVDREFARGLLSVTQSVVPSEIYLDQRGLLDAAFSAEDVAAWLGDYRYRDNIGPYVPRDVVQRERLNQKPFAAVMPTSFIADLEGKDLAAYGSGNYPDGDPHGVPPITW